MTYSKTFISIGALIEARQIDLCITDSDLARSIGYNNARVVALIRGGKIRLPLTKVPALADALTVDARQVLTLAMAESVPGLFDVVEKILNPLSLAQHEVDLIKHCRKLAATQFTAFIVVAQED